MMSGSRLTNAEQAAAAREQEDAVVQEKERARMERATQIAGSRAKRLAGNGAGTEPDDDADAPLPVEAPRMPEFRRGRRGQPAKP